MRQQLKSSGGKKNEYEPVIKWSGSKRSVAPLLGLLIPEAGKYIEPFIGSGAMLPFRITAKAIASDIIVELIELWKIIRDQPEIASKEYEWRWKKLQEEGHQFYYKLRHSFNKERNPFDFLFLTRTCVNGLIRFNASGDFNNSLHHTRPGISPDRLNLTLMKWSNVIKDVTFIVADYKEILEQVKKDDFVFLDPPYVGTKGRYTVSSFEINKFYEQLEIINKVEAKWMLTFDGTAGNRTYSVGIPQELYKIKFDLPTGNSPFTKLMRTSIDMVVESVYLNYNPPIQLLAHVTNYLNNRIRTTCRQNMQQGFSFDDIKLKSENDVEVPVP